MSIWGRHLFTNHSFPAWLVFSHEYKQNVLHMETCHVCFNLLQAHISGVGSSSCLAKRFSEQSLYLHCTHSAEPSIYGTPFLCHARPILQHPPQLPGWNWLVFFLFHPGAPITTPTTITILILCQGLSVVPTTAPRVLCVLSNLHQIPYYKCHYCSHLIHKDT